MNPEVSVNVPSEPRPESARAWPGIPSGQDLFCSKRATAVTSPARGLTGQPAWLRGARVPAQWCRAMIPQRRPHILVIAPGSLGDALLLTGFLRVLSGTLPNARIFVLVPARAAPVLRGFPYATVLSFPRYSPEGLLMGDKLRRWWIGFRLLRRSYAWTFDLSEENDPIWEAVARCVSASNRMAMRTLVPGLSRGDDSGAEHEGLPRRLPHQLDRLAAVLQAAGFSLLRGRADILPALELTETERQFAARFLSREGQTAPPGIRLAVCPGARFPQKDWSVERFADLLVRLAATRPLTAIVLGGAEDRGRFAWLREHAGTTRSLRLVDGVGRMTPREAAAVIAQCDACVGNDTYGLHAAIAVETPSVVVMGGGDFGQWLPWGDPNRHRMVHHPMDCYGCRWQCQSGDFACLTHIRAEEVAAILTDLLEIARGVRGPSA